MMKFIWVLLTAIILGISSCDSPISKVKTTEMPTKATAVTVATDTVVVHETITITSKDSTIVSESYKVVYETGVKTTVKEVIRTSFPKLSEMRVNEIVADILNPPLQQQIDADIKEVVNIKLGQLAQLGINAHVDENSPINISNRYEYCQSSLKLDSIRRKDLKWEHQKKKK